MAVHRSAVVDYIQSKPDVLRIDGIAHVYFNYKQQGSQTLPSVYASLVGQLVNQVPNLRGAVKDLFKKHDNGKKVPGIEELIGVLSNLTGSRQIVLAFDALDEASEHIRKGLMTQLEKLIEKNRTFFVFLTSRPDVQLKSTVLDKTKLMDVAANDSDLTVFARAHLEDDEVKEILGEDSRSIIPEIVDAVVSHAAGMCVNSHPHLSLLP
jgi:hypothetical protein